MARTLKLTEGESVTVLRNDPELLEVEAEYAPSGKAPPAHFHPRQIEHFEVLEGVLSTRVDGEEHPLEAGEVLEVPDGVSHQMWNAGIKPTRVLWQTRPAGRTEEWFAAIDRLHREGKVGRNGMPGPIAFAALLTEYEDVFRLSARPRFFLRGLLAALAPIGRARGALK